MKLIFPLFLIIETGLEKTVAFNWTGVWEKSMGMW
jgi:hypothetical protein